MTPYHYSVVRCRDAAVHGELRNVGLLVASPAEKKTWLRRASLKQRAHLVGDDADFVKGLLDLLQDEFREVVRAGDPPVLHAWMKARSRPTDDALVLAVPAMGIASDLTAEVGRLREFYLGRQGGGGSNQAQKVRDDALRSLGLHKAFVPMELPSGPATWRFGSVSELSHGHLVFHALRFAQKTPENILDAAFRNTGRMSEVRHYHDGVECLTVATGPTSGVLGPAFRRAITVMNDNGLNVVEPHQDAIEAELRRFGLGASERAHA